MIIQHNIPALNSYRNLTNNNKGVASNLEKLSSGYAINRAGDDAAGLAISEKMRAQITGLETAQKNANDGISLVQTAEGALQEVHTMLNRMVELAQQSANGTYQDEVDRENLESELVALKDEINRISESTNFNGINLLDGSLGGSTKELEVTVDGAAATANAAVAGEYETAAVATTGNGNKSTYSFTYSVNGETKTITVEYTGAATAANEAQAIKAALEANEEFAANFTVSEASGKLTFKATEAGTDGAKVVNANGTAVTEKTKAKDESFTVGSLAEGNVITVGGKTFTYGTTADLENGVFTDINDLKTLLAEEGLKLIEIDTGADSTGFTANTAIVADPAKAKKGISLQIGDTSDEFNQLYVNIGKMDVGSLGLSNISIKDAKSAKAAVDVIKNAINMVSSTRGNLGAIQNRLEHTINNLSVTTENMTAAESRIRDVDMAEEMMKYTKNNILVQSSQAMLAQANQIPQGVLQLLQ